MYTEVEWWTRIRLEVLRGEVSNREVLWREGIHRETLKKIEAYSEPPGTDWFRKACREVGYY